MRCRTLVAIFALVLAACGGGGRPRPAEPIPADGLLIPRTFELEAVYDTLWGGTVAVHHRGRHDPDDVLIVTPVDRGRGHVDVPLQVWWADTLSRWVIQRVDGNAITEGQAFNVSVYERGEDAFLFQVPAPSDWAARLPDPSPRSFCHADGFLGTQNITPRIDGSSALNSSATRYPTTFFSREGDLGGTEGFLAVDSHVTGADLRRYSTFNIVRMNECRTGVGRYVQRAPGASRLFLGDLGRGRGFDARLQVSKALTWSPVSGRPYLTNTIPVLRYDAGRGEWEIRTSAGLPPGPNARYFVFEDALETRITP